MTRARGPQPALRTVFTDCLQRHKAQRSIVLNDTIVNELSDVKAMIEAKSKKVQQREKELVRREQ